MKTCKITKFLALLLAGLLLLPLFACGEAETPQPSEKPQYSDVEIAPYVPLPVDGAGENLPSVEWILEPTATFDVIGYVSPNRIRTSDGGTPKQALRTLEGKLLARADLITSCPEDNCVIVMTEQKYGLMDLDGNILYDYQEKHIFWHQGSILMEKEKGGESGYWKLDRNGEILGTVDHVFFANIEEPFDNKYIYAADTDTLYKILRNGKTITALEEVELCPEGAVLGGSDLKLADGKVSYDYEGHFFCPQGKVKTENLFSYIHCLSEIPAPEKRVYLAKLKGKSGEDRKTYVTDGAGNRLYRNGFQSVVPCGEYVIAQEGEQWGVMKIPVFPEGSAGIQAPDNTTESLPPSLLGLPSVEWILEPFLAYGNAFFAGKNNFLVLNDGYGAIVDRRGAVLFEAENIYRTPYENCFVAYKNKQCALIDWNGDFIIEYSDRYIEISQNQLYLQTGTDSEGHALYCEIDGGGNVIQKKAEPNHYISVGGFGPFTLFDRDTGKMYRYEGGPASEQLTPSPRPNVPLLGLSPI